MPVQSVLCLGSCLLCQCGQDYSPLPLLSGSMHLVLCWGLWSTWTWILCRNRYGLICIPVHADIQQDQDHLLKILSFSIVSSWLFFWGGVLFVCFETEFLCSFGACPRTSSCRPGWPRSHRNPFASASQVLGLKTCHYSLAFLAFFFNIKKSGIRKCVDLHLHLWFDSTDPPVCFYANAKLYSWAWSRG